MMEWLWAGGKRVGYVDGDSYYRSGNGPEHKLRQPPGWAVERTIITDLVARGSVKWVVVGYMGRRYRTALGDFITHGISFGRGYGEQVAVVEERWHWMECPQQQMGLWEGGAR